MKRVSPQLRKVAKLLKASEARGSAAASVDAPPAFPAIDKLRAHLSTLMGRSGCQALLSRALVLAAVEVPCLAALRVVGDGELEGLTDAQASAGAAALAEGEVALLAQLLRLLVAFIGPALTLSLINHLWPQLSLNDADLRGLS